MLAMPPTFDDALAANEDVAHEIHVAGEQPGIDQLRGVAPGEQRRIIVEHDEIRAPARLECADAAAGSLRAAGERACVQGFARARRGRARTDVAMPRDEALAVFEPAQFLDRRHRDVAVGTDAEHAAVVEIGLEREQAVAEVRLGGRAQAGHCAARGEPAPLVCFEMGRMGTFRLWNNHTVYGAYGDQTGPNDYQIPDSAASDASAYHLAAIKFVQTAAGSFEARLQETELVSSLTQGVQVPTSSDLFGDGLNDLFGPIGCQRDAVNAGHPGCQVINDGTHGPAVLTVYSNPNATTTVDIATSTFEPSSQFLLNENVGSNGPHSLASLAELSLNNPSSSGGRTADVHVGMPEMLQSVVDGVGDSTSWAFTTLSNPGSTTDDVTGTSLPVYSFPAIGGYTDTRHFYFTSTMPVVVGMLGINGAGGVSGFRSAAYGYSEAMYNHLGRGFQGFHKITTWVLDETRNRQTQTIATYNQKFPLTGKLDSLDTVIPPPAGQTVGQTIQHGRPVPWCF